MKSKPNGNGSQPDPRKLFHVIRSGSSLHPLSYEYETFSDMQSYLANEKASIDDLIADQGLDRFAEQSEIASQYAQLEAQLGKIAKNGTDKGIKAACPGFDVSIGGGIDMRHDVEIASYWPRFVPLALRLLRTCLKEEMEEGSNEDAVREHLALLHRLARSRDKASLRFAREFQHAVETITTNTLQHF